MAKGSKSKNVPLVLAALAIIIVIAVIVFILLSNVATEGKDITMEVYAAMPSTSCDYNDQDTYFSSAMIGQNLSLCSCINDSNRADQCRVFVLDQIYYGRALDTFSADQCNAISQKKLADLCLEMIKGGSDFLASQSEYKLAETQFNSGDFQSAILTLEEYIDKNALDIEAIILLSVAYSNEALTTYKLGEYVPKALSAADKALSIDSNNSEAYRAKGFAYEVNTELQKAIDQYTIALEKSPNNIGALVARGHAYDKQGSLPKAKADFEAAKALDPEKKYAFLYAQMCRLYSTNGDLFLEAIGHCRTAIGLYNRASSYGSDTLMGLNLTVGEIYLAMGNTADALTSMLTALSYNPNSPDALVGVSNVYAATGEYELEKQYAQKAIELDPMRTVAYMSLSNALFFQGQYPEAEIAALKALDVIDKDVSLLFANKKVNRRIIYIHLSQIYLAKGDSAKAAEYKAKGDAI